jgi:protein dithiol oxidoreductase (disulfide-forming)
MLQRVFAFLLMLAAAPLALAQPFEAGRDYQRIEPAQPTASGAKIEVLEIFGYPCIHCAHAAPEISRWRKTLPPDVQFGFMPAVFGAVWEAYARAYYTAETMGVVERTHDKLFEVLHTERRPIRNLDDIAAFYAEYGVDKEAFLATLNSFPVNAKIARASEQVSAYGVEGTPTMIVAGKYRVMSPGGEDGFARMLQVVDHLIALERGAKKPAG